MATESQIVPALTNQEDSFALAIIEYGGNFGAAYRSVFGDDVKNPSAKARELLTRPEVAKRIQELSVAIEEHAHISLGSHLTKLAEIRDFAINTNQLKTALAAERSRGEAAGFYGLKPGTHNPDASPDGKASVTINIVGGSPSNIQEWSARHGKPPLIVDVSPQPAR